MKKPSKLVLSDRLHQDDLIRLALRASHEGRNCLVFLVVRYDQAVQVDLYRAKKSKWESQ